MQVRTDNKQHFGEVLSNECSLRYVVFTCKSVPVIGIADLCLWASDILSAYFKQTYFSNLSLMLSLSIQSIFSTLSLEC